MKRLAQISVAVASLAFCVMPLWARRDPLAVPEVDQLREVAQEPEKRIPLYVKFIRVRATNLEQLSTDPRFTADRGSQIHDLIEDVDTLVQEMDDNIDVYVERHFDLRKPLKDVIELDNELQGKLRTMKQSANPEQVKTYGFALDNAIDSVNGSLDGARKLMQDQEVEFKNAKKKK
jgi:hypothetical protein